MNDTTEKELLQVLKEISGTLKEMKEELGEISGAILETGAMIEDEEEGE
jgi:hypothetical protein